MTSANHSDPGDRPDLDTRHPPRIGVVGFSSPHFDQDQARVELRRLLRALLERWPGPLADVEVVSGLTNQGVPKIAYELARELGLRTVGISARQALRVRAGVFPVDRRWLVGDRFGDESQDFIAYVDALIRVGGGEQSRAEVELFRRRFADTPVVFHAMHPGWADTPGVAESLPGFRRVTGPFLRSPEEGADTIVWLASADEPGTRSGVFWLDRAPRRTVKLPWTKAPAGEAARLWDLVSEQTGVVASPTAGVS